MNLVRKRIVRIGTGAASVLVDADAVQVVGQASAQNGMPAPGMTILSLAGGTVMPVPGNPADIARLLWGDDVPADKGPGPGLRLG